MKSQRYNNGVVKMMEFTDTSNPNSSTHVKIEENLKDIAPDVSRFMIEFTYGEIYTRDGLDNKTRAIITISSLVALGTMPQLELHINAGLTAGLTPNEIIEIFIQLISYVGFPRVLNAIEIAKTVFAQRGVSINI